MFGGIEGTLMNLSKFSESELFQIIDSGLTENMSMLELTEFDPSWVRVFLERETIENTGKGLDDFLKTPIGGRRTVQIYARLELERPVYWTRVKQEFRMLLCGDDKKYADLQKKIDATGTKSQTAIVSMIAAGVAAQVGVAAGILVPFCALLLLAVLRVGKNAYCSGIELDIPVVMKGKKK
jgi:hypothetical protein